MLTLGWSLADRWGTPVGSFHLVWNSNKQPGFLLPILAITIGILAASGLYGTDDKRRNLFSLLKSLSLAESIVLLICYLYNPSAVLSRSTFLISWVLTVIFVLAGRSACYLILLKSRSQGLLRHAIYLIGKPEDIRRAIPSIEKTQKYHIRAQENPSKMDTLEDLYKMIERIRKQKVSEVFVCSQLSAINQFFLYWELKATGIHLRILPIGIELPIQCSEIKMVHGIATMQFRSPPIVGSDFWIKRGFDLVAASLILALASPFFLLIAILIKLDSSGPIFYKQTRVGLKGRHFKVWKFRTMVVDAEQRQKQLEKNNEMKGGILFKIKDDPRITRVGKFLRHYSLDELPQIINILLGEMSLVGPRPFPLRDVERFSEHHFLRQEVLPGITGLWQVSGRSNIVDFEDVFRLDITYIQNWSIALDFQILFQTFEVILNRNGAY